MLCVGSTLPLAKQSLDEAPYKLSGAVAKPAGITFWSLAFSWIRLNLGFLLRKNSLLYSSNLPLGVPKLFTLSHTTTAKIFLAPLPEKKKTSARGVSHAHPLLCFKFCFYFIFACFILSKTQKISFLLVASICLLLVLLK
jgi:hypothetical protein